MSSIYQQELKKDMENIVFLCGSPRTISAFGNFRIEALNIFNLYQGVLHREMTYRESGSTELYHNNDGTVTVAFVKQLFTNVDVSIRKMKQKDSSTYTNILDSMAKDVNQPPSLHG